MEQNNIDAKIKDLFDVLNKQKIEVEQAEAETKQSWRTNCAYPKNDGVPPINIQTASELMLVDILAEMLRESDYNSKAADMLGISLGTPAKYTLDDWIADFKKRIAILNLRAKKDKLAVLEKRLNAIVSPEQRRAMELAAITESLEL